MPAYGTYPYAPPSGGGYVGSFSPYFSNQNAYGSAYGTPGGFLSTPLGQIGANQSPDTYFQRLIAPWAGGLDTFSRFVQGQQGRVMQGLEQARMSNPNLNATDYLGNVANYGQFLRQWRSMAPQDRGERGWPIAAPRTRSLGF